ncbi:MAG: acyl-CoA/acyl-ACP dehydrogenase [Halobacteriovoraceae bacterium]|nr:acyl-CoA/acyl-ACP dehydrogenase [Halobacteriovoraceae bacterium]MBT5095527.1 acyl-CoA/acyl-ACP dehydrogenase [Halobacteriovoraceae bacterium]
MNYFSDESEWKWLFRNGLDWDKILPLYYPSYPTEDGLESKEEVIDFLEELMGALGDWASGSVAERAEKFDLEGPGTVENGRQVPNQHLKDLIREGTELSVFGLPLPREYGGMQAPATLYLLMLGQVARSCLSSTSAIAFFTSMGEMIMRYCDKETQERLMPKVIAGEISGSMNLTEPGCGSDLGMIKTSAALQDDGTYLLNGSKCFITNGGGGIAFVLAKVKGDPDDLSGISMFFMEQDPEGSDGTPNFNVSKNESKFGMHGSYTTEVIYENSVAKMVGEQGQGFKYMLHLMNEARIATGMQALGGIEGCLAYARKYAEERVQFGKPIAELPLFKRNLEDWETERDALRAMLVDSASHFDIYLALDHKKSSTNDLSKEEEALLKEALLWSRKRTPLIKYYACEAYTTLSQKAIQALGGYGYMNEYPVGRYHRDSFGPLLYEGTSQIQALMALKDMIKYAIKDPKRFAGSIFAKHPTSAFLNGENEWSKAFKSTHYRFKKKMVKLFFSALKPDQASKMLDFKNWQREDNVNDLMEHAETLCQGLAYMETLRVLCEHSNKDAQRKGLFMRYHQLVKPRLEAIYCDWDLRTGK